MRLVARSMDSTRMAAFQPSSGAPRRALSGTTGAVLDPIGALRERIRMAPGAVVRVSFATGVAPDRASALALVRKYRDGSAAARAFSMAFTHVHITLQNLGLSDEQAILFDRLASRVFGTDASCLSPAALARPMQSIRIERSAAPVATNGHAVNGHSNGHASNGNGRRKKPAASNGHAATNGAKTLVEVGGE